MYIKYLQSLLLHKWYVFLAGLKTGVPIWRLIVHDWSKFTPVEFIGYAKWIHGGIKDKLMWARAWHHHQRRNPHHHEFYILSWFGEPNFYDEVGKKTGTEFITILPMPLTYVKEMVADWMGASKAYTGSWDMSEWLSQNGMNLDKNMHRETVSMVWGVLIDIGYMQTDGEGWGFLLSGEN